MEAAFLLKGSSDRYRSLWKLTRDIALRALELATCQTAYWKKSSKSREEYKGGERERREGGKWEVTRQFPLYLFFPPCSSFPTYSSSPCPLITVEDTAGVLIALIKQQQIAETQGT